MASTLNNQAGGCCCDPCAPIDAFTEVVELATANQVVVRDQQHPQSPYPPYVQAEIKGGAGASLLILIGWDDADGIKCEFKPGVLYGGRHGTLQVTRKDGQPLHESLIHIDGLVAGEWHTVTVCVNTYLNDNIRVVVEPYESDAVTWNWYVPHAFEPGRQAGYGTGATHSGKATFRNYAFKRLWYCRDASEDCEKHDMRTYCESCGAFSCYLGRTNSSDQWDGIVNTYPPTGPNELSMSRIGDLDGYQWQSFTVNLFDFNDEAIVGMSNPTRTEQIYLKLWFTSHAGDPLPGLQFHVEVYEVTGGGSPTLLGSYSTPIMENWVGPHSTIAFAFLYDERYDRLHWWAGMVGELGPNYVFALTHKETIPDKMRRLIIGTGAVSSAPAVGFGSFSYSTTSMRCWSNHTLVPNCTGYGVYPWGTGCGLQYGPVKVAIEIAGVARGDACPSTVVLDYDWFNGNFEGWYYEGPSPCPDWGYYALDLEANRYLPFIMVFACDDRTNDTTSVYVYLGMRDGGLSCFAGAIYEKVYSPRVNVRDLEVTLDSSDLHSSNSYINFSGAEITLRAEP